MKLFICVFLCALTAQAQLAVTVSSPKIAGQKAIVPLAMTNNFAESVESARAICFLMDEQGQMIGQSAKWVIGGDKERSMLEPKTGTTYNFVITTAQPFATTNLTAKVSFSRLVMNGGKSADVQQTVIITSANK